MDPMHGYCQRCGTEREMNAVVETRVANRTVEADGRSGDRKAHRGACSVCGGFMLRVGTEMVDEALEGA